MLFALLPPEINSGLMYAGPGSGPVMAASAAWEELAADLHSTAASSQAALSELIDGLWTGPSALRMAAATAPYVTWINTTAAQAEEAASQAKLAAGAFETAHAMTIPPAVVAANRILLMSLVATNFFGQNTPAIAATEMEYAEMWAQDAMAMEGYALTGSQAAALPSFTPPPLATAGPALHTAAAAEPAITSATAHALAAASQVTAAIPQTLQALTSTLPSPSTLLNLGVAFQTGFIEGQFAQFVQLNALGLPLSAIPPPAAAPLEGASIATLFSGVQGFLNAGFGPAVSQLADPALIAAQMAQAHMIGPLSVPPCWAQPDPTMVRAAPVLPNATASEPSLVSRMLGGAFGQGLLGNFAGVGMRSLATDAAKAKPVASANP
jgi:PPE-repeat protein